MINLKDGFKFQAGWSGKASISNQIIPNVFLYDSEKMTKRQAGLDTQEKVRIRAECFLLD